MDQISLFDMESDQKQEYLDLVKTLNYHVECYYKQD